MTHTLWTTYTPTEKLLETAQAIGMNNLSVGGVAKKQVYFLDQMRKSLEDGADFLALDSQGKDAMDWLTHQDMDATAVSVAAAKLLIDQGYPILDRPALNTLKGSIREKIIAHLARKERDGVLIRSATGGNLLHAIAEHPRNMIEACMIANPILRLSNTSASHQWAAKPDQYGRTPLHVMWQDRSEPFEDDDKPWVWDVCIALENFGANLVAPDNNGVCVLDLMERTMGAGHVLANDDLIEENGMTYVAKIRAILIDRATPISSAKKRTLRL